MMDVKSEPARIEIRTTADKKKLLKEAAMLSGMNLSDFMLSNALDRAYQRLQEVALMEVSLRDFSRMMEVLDCPPEPTEELVKSLKRQQERGQPFELHH